MGSVSFYSGLSDHEIEWRLANIERIEKRGVYLITDGMRTRQLSGATKFWWVFLGMFCPCIRASIYHTDLGKTRSIFLAMHNDPRITGNARLFAALNRAQAQFNTLYPVRVHIPSVSRSYGPSYGHVRAGSGVVSRPIVSSVPRVSSASPFTVRAGSGVISRPVVAAPVRVTPSPMRPSAQFAPRPIAPAGTVMAGSARR